MSFVLICLSTQYLHYREVASFKKNTQNQFFEFEQGRFYSRNNAKWYQTVKKTSRYLSDHLDAGETFFALPYDPIYYFLTKKDSPSKYIAFFEFLNMTDAQQENIINTLESKNIQYILVSNRIESTELGIGNFGKDHCLLLNDYIQSSFAPVAIFGEWKKPAKAMANHGTMILKKRIP